jgi:DNA-binding GntR family transcriptional regulator
MDNVDLSVNRQASILRNQVEEKLRAAILIGRFQPGQRLVERELCDLIGVSRSSIREALRQLVAEGLVTAVPHRGPVVSTITVAEAEQLYAVRALLEVFAARTFAERRPPDAMAKLMRAVDQLEDAASGGQQDALLASKSAFYEALLEGCGNAFVKQILTNLQNRITLLRGTSMRQPGRVSKSLVEIRAIADAIVAGEPERAERACANHIWAAAEVAVAVLARTESQTSG